MSVLACALSYAASGLCPIPIRPDGSKAPASSWKNFQSRIPTEEELKSSFSGQCGIAIVCGAVSRNLLVLDFDLPGYFSSWCEAVDSQDPNLLCLLPIVETPTGFGRHVYLRSPIPMSGEKLAKEIGQQGKAPWVVAIESRGESQYVLAPGCPPACHSAGKEYRLISGPLLEETPLLSEDQIKILIDTSKSFNRYIEESQVVSGSSAELNGIRPGDDYCLTGDWDALLESHRWEKIREKDSVSFWRRPDKVDSGISATLGFCGSEKHGKLLYVFSSNAGPFEAGRAYTLFAARAYLDFAGDFSECAKQLVSDGHGQRSSIDVEEEIKTEISKLKIVVETIGESGAIVPHKKLSALLKTERLFKRTWERNRKEFELDQTRYDASLLWFAIRSGWTLAEQISLIYEHRKIVDCEPDKAFNVAYISRRIAWLSNPTLRSEDDALASCEAKSVTDSGQGAIITAIRQRSEVSDFEKLLKRGSEDELFFIVHTDARRTKIGSTEVLTNQSAWRMQLRRTLNRWPKTMKPFEWDAFQQLLIQIQIQEEYPDEHEAIGFAEAVVRYVSESPICRQDDEDQRRFATGIRFGRPYISKYNEYGLSLSTFQAWLAIVYGGREFHRSRVRSGLKDLGFQSRQVSFCGARRWYHLCPIPGSEIEAAIAMKNGAGSFHATDNELAQISAESEEMRNWGGV